MFFLTRILVGLPLSISFQKDMVFLLWNQEFHSLSEVAFVMAANVFINLLNVYWLMEHLVGGADGDPSESICGGESICGVGEGEGGEGGVGGMKVVELRKQLKELGLPTTGLKAVLAARLSEHYAEKAARSARTLREAPPASPSRRRSNFMEATLHYGNKSESFNELSAALREGEVDKMFRKPPRALRILRMGMVLFVVASAGAIYRWVGWEGALLRTALLQTVL